jgi:hypothetical protein
MTFEIPYSPARPPGLVRWEAAARSARKWIEHGFGALMFNSSALRPMLGAGPMRLTAGDAVLTISRAKFTGLEPMIAALPELRRKIVKGNSHIFEAVTTLFTGYISDSQRKQT